MNLGEKKEKCRKNLASYLPEEVLDCLIEYVSLSVMEIQFSLNLNEYEDQVNIVSEENSQNLKFSNKS